MSQSPVDRRALLLEAGLAEFAQHPYAEASTDRITSGTGISKGLLFHYFGSKRDLYLACLGEALSRVAASEPSAVEGGDVLDWMIAAARQRVEHAAAQPLATALVNRAARESSSEVVAETRELLAESQRARVADSRRRLSAWVATARLRPGIDAAVLVDAIELQVAGVVGRRLAADLTDPQRFLSQVDALADELRTHLSLLLHGALERDVE